MKYYPPSNHIYYKNSNIAINKLNIKNLEIITEIEKELLIKSYEILHIDLNEAVKFDENYLCNTHHTIFSSLYEWGGKYRSVNISKGDGRCIRLFFDMIVTFNGYEYIDYKTTLGSNEYILASINCMEADCNNMKKIIDHGLSKVIN